MKSICFCNSTLAWGGGESWHLAAAKSLAARGWRVLLLCHPDGALFKRARHLPGIAAVPMPLGRLSFLNPLVRRRLVRFFRRERVDALIMNLPADLKAAGPAAKTAGVKHVIYRRGSALPVRNSLLNRRLFGTVITRLIVNSRATLAQALANNPDLIPPDRVTILPNGMDIRAFDKALAGPADSGADQAPVKETGLWPVQALPGISPDNAATDAVSRRIRPFVIGNAGRLNRQKGQHMLLHLVRRLADAGLDARLVIAGAGEREAELKALASSLGVAERTVFTGFLEDLAPFWRAIDCFVLTSLWEGFGNVIIEAGLARKPVFAFSVSNLPELIREGENGRLFPLPAEERALCPDWNGNQRGRLAGTSTPYAELDAMAEGLLALARDGALRRKMGEAGRRLAERYSQEACMDALEKLLEQERGGEKRGG